MTQDDPPPARPGAAPAPKKRPAHVEIREMELEDLTEVFALVQRLFRADAYPNLYRAKK